MSHPATASLRIHHTSAAPLLRSVTGTGGDLTSRAADAGVTLEGPLEMGGLAVEGHDGVQVDLSPRQVELLALFLAAPRKVWSRDLLHWVAWGDTSPSRRVDVQLCRLRTRTGLDLFRNVRDRGWALRPVS
jgi:DNA-binding response OmpR family regulator